MEGRDMLNGKQRHQLKHRELFLSRQVETLPATHIRGKCSVTLLNETESFLSYLNKDVSVLYRVECSIYVFVSFIQQSNIKNSVTKIIVSYPFFPRPVT